MLQFIYVKEVPVCAFCTLNASKIKVSGAPGRTADFENSKAHSLLKYRHLCATMKMLRHGPARGTGLEGDLIPQGLFIWVYHGYNPFGDSGLTRIPG